MTISIDYGSTNIIDVQLADMTLVSGTQYDHDSNAFRLSLKSLESSENGIVFTDTHRHVAADTIAGATDARKIIILAPYSVRYPDSQITVVVKGSNNNIHDVADSKLVQNQAQIIPSNSFGLVTVTSGSGLSAEQSEMLEHLWQDRGFDVSNPVTVDEAAGTISVAGTLRTWAGTVIKTLTRS